MEPKTLQIRPIGVFSSAARYPYDVPRQGAVAGDNIGVIRLYPEYAEGLADNVNDDEESRQFYCEVIIDEAKKMNNMVILKI